MSKTKRFVLTVLIATVVGPPIGGVLVYFATLASMFFRPNFTVSDLSDISLSALGETFVIVVGVAYLAGGPIAFIAGLIIAIVGLRREPTFLIIMLAVIAANVGFYALTAREVYSPGSRIPFEPLLIALGFSVVAATVCWLLFRRYLRTQ